MDDAKTALNYARAAELRASRNLAEMTSPGWAEGQVQQARTRHEATLAQLDAAKARADAETRWPSKPPSDSKDRRAERIARARAAVGCGSGVSARALELKLRHGEMDAARTLAELDGPERRAVVILAHVVAARIVSQQASQSKA